ncbi:MAG: alkaline phosphatase [Bacteroides sp.]|nr:alkaline phosphatase [Bacteroides sp.]
MKRFILTALFLTTLLLSLPLAYSRAQECKHLVFIGLDGWGSYSLERSSGTTFHSLLDQSTYTLEKRSVLPSSSAVNWATMFMGASPEIHGYTEWGSQTPEIPSREVNRNGIFPSIFSVLREAEPEAEMGCLYEWNGIKFLIDTLSVSHHAIAPAYTQNPTLLCEMAEQYIVEKKPRLTAVIFDNPDHIGHKEGHDTPAYYTQLEELATYVQRIIDATHQAGIYDETVFILTSDHGGIEKGHGGKTLEELRTPFLMWGKGIRPGHQIAENMAQYDVAPTMALLLELTPPQVWTGKALPGP